MNQTLITIVSNNDYMQCFRSKLVLSRKLNKISNQIRSKIIRVHGTKHQETTLTKAPNDRKRSKIFTTNLQLNF